MSIIALAGLPSSLTLHHTSSDIYTCVCIAANIKSRTMSRIHTAAVLFIIAMALVAACVAPPIPQDPGYHAFADQRTLLAIPNALDVLSNLPFIAIGCLGLKRLGSSPVAGVLPPLLWHHRIFFLGVVLTGFGSAYYHWHPDNATLFWDRLPMTIGFMAFFSLLVGESLSLQWGRRLLWPLLVAGGLSVLYWHMRDDLRPYALVQFLPMLLIPYILLFFPSPCKAKAWLWALAGFYLLAKFLEMSDRFWFELTGFISGHSLKHLAAALAPLCLYKAIGAGAKTPLRR